MSPPHDERLRRLAAWADRFADPAFTLGTWIPAREDADGIIHVGWYEISEAGQEFVSEMYELGWVFNFDWTAWLGTPRGHALAKSPGTIAAATDDELARLLTAIIRSERFGDGQLEGAFESGLLVAIARRAEELHGRV